MSSYFDIKSDYKLKYKYSAISAKPKVYSESINMDWDGILCYSTYEKELLSNYSLTYIVEKLNFIDFEKKLDNKKKTLLYLPTFGDVNAIIDTVQELKKLSKKFRLITKEHHVTNYLMSEEGNKKILEEVFDELYDSNYPLEKLLSISDVVLSDNSGSIFEALYSQTPVCLCSNLNNNCLDDINSLQSSLVEKGIIPHTCNSKDLSKVINKALSKNIVELQRKTSNELFPLREHKNFDTYINVIEKYLNDEVNADYFKLRKHMRENLIKDIKHIINNQDKEIRILREKNSNAELELSYYKNGKLYRIAKKVYSFKNKIMGAKK